MIKSIRSTAFAAYNTCPYKYKLSKEIRYGNENFDVGTAVHDTLQIVPQYLLEGKDWQPVLIEKIGKMEKCSHSMIEKCLKTIEPGVRSIEQALLEGFTIKTEVELQRQLPCGIVITGKTDRIDSTAKLFRIIDYKTGSYVPTQQDMLGDLQLLIYSFLTQEMVSLNQKIEIGLFSLGRDVMQVVGIPINIEMVIEDVLDKRAILMARDEETGDFRPNPSTLCEYCECKYKCKFWEKYQHDYSVPADVYEKIHLLEMLLSYSKGLEGVVSQLKNEIVSYMVADNIESLEINGKERYFTQRIAYKENNVSVSKPYIKV